MKTKIATAFAALLMTATPFMTQAQDIFSKPFETVHGTAPFSRFNDDTWMPAIDRAIAQAKQEVDAITMQRSRPDFENTIVALENAGSELDRVAGVF